MVESLARRLARHRPYFHASDAQLDSGPGPSGGGISTASRRASIRWSTTQIKRWGSCTLETREIRISERLRAAPDWVLDAVIVHELVHLFEPTHSARFRQLERRYPRRDEADSSSRAMRSVSSSRGPVRPRRENRPQLRAPEARIASTKGVVAYLLATLAAFVNALTSVLQRIGVETAPEDTTLRWSLMAHACAGESGWPGSPSCWWSSPCRRPPCASAS